MIIVLQAAAVVAVLIGLVTIGYGIPVKEFSFGNTLILVGTISLCTGVILLALSVVALELRMVARRLASGRPAQEPRARTALPPFPAAAGAADQIEPSMAPPVMPPPWHEDPRARPDAQPEPAQTAPPPKPKRNLLFSSSVRKDRERFPRPGDPAQPPGAPPLPETGETPSASFEDAWQRPDRAKGTEFPPQRRSSRLSATPSEFESGHRLRAASRANRRAAEYDRAEIRRR